MFTCHVSKLCWRIIHISVSIHRLELKEKQTVKKTRSSNLNLVSNNKSNEMNFPQINFLEPFPIARRPSVILFILYVTWQISRVPLTFQCLRHWCMQIRKESSLSPLFNSPTSTLLVIEFAIYWACATKNVDIFSKNSAAEWNEKNWKYYRGQK